MLESCHGKLLVYASCFASHGNRLRSVSIAVEKTAELLKLDVEVITFNGEFAPIYVYYRNGNEEPVPIYCNKGGESDIQQIYKALTNMMFVLSFHPKHSALKQIRKKVMQFS
jgi:hypothetical protein